MIGSQFAVTKKRHFPIYEMSSRLRVLHYRLVQSACWLLLAVCLASCKRSPSSIAPGSPSDQFLRLMNAGKNYLDQGDATNALAVYKKAEAIVPHDVDVRLNLANCYLLGG